MNNKANKSLGLFTLLFLLASQGCILGTPKPTTMPLKNVDQAQLMPDFWWNKPAVADVQSRDFQKLWDACKREMYLRLYVVDREQYRDGLLTSEPLVSKQVTEFWRDDTVGAHDIAESTLATMRRTVHFELTRQPDGNYDATPKVLVERFESAERRLTAINQYHSAFNGPRTTFDAPDASGEPLPSDYWYPVRRDIDLEKLMAQEIRQRLEPQ